MQALTIGVGPYKKLAEYSAARMTEMTGLEVIVLDDHHMKGLDLPHPAWLKLYAYDMAEDADIMIFDADLFCMKPWHPQSFIEDRDMAVVRDEMSTQVQTECNLYGIGLGNYFNSGLMLLARSLNVFSDARRYMPRYGKWLEQTALNREAWLQQLCPTFLPRAYNRLLWPGQDSYEPYNLREMNAVNLHFASIGNPETILGIVSKL